MYTSLASPPKENLLHLRGFNKQVYYDFSIFAEDFPSSVFTRGDRLVSLGGHKMVIFGDIAELSTFRGWDVKEDINNLSKILPFVPNLREQRRIKAHLDTN